jgi:hypothetical protein
MVLIPTLYGRWADLMGSRQLALRYTAIMGFEHLQPIGF